MRSSRGPRQPGGGRQSAGPRHKQRQFRHAEALPRGEGHRAPGKPGFRGSSPKPGGGGRDAGPRHKQRQFGHPEETPRSEGYRTSGKPGRYHKPGKPGSRPLRPNAAKFDNAGRRGERQPSASIEARHRHAPPDDRQRKETPPPAAQMPTTVQNITVSADENGMRVDRFFEARFPGLSFSHIQRIVRKGEVRVNGKRTEPKSRLETGQTVRIPPLRLDAPKPRRMGNEADQDTADFLRSITLFEDDDVLVLNKPLGLAVQGGSGTTRHLDGMLDVLRDAHGQRPRLVHRLDKDTAGCLLVAKTRFAASALAKTFRSRSARKVYWALVAGVPRVPQGRISTYLAKDEREDESIMRVARHGDEGASHAVTYYAIVETSGPLLSWISLKPVTGRTHQLRAHMDHIGHPIVGDPKYFTIENWQLPGGLQNKLHLLARRIAVPHPRGGVIDITAPLPPHMQQSWNLLGLDAKRYDPIEDAPEE
jgi:23S rRNA pseudouridine955/2504/2580 synthase